MLTLDAMADAALLRACENSAEVAATSLYSITRLLNDPKDIYIAMRAEPRENYSDTYTASKEETTNEENTLLAKGGTADKADLKYFRHLYNLRWSADWKIDDKGTYTLTPQASNSTGLNWTGGGVTVYCASGEKYPAAKVPSLNDPVAWPTIPELGEEIVLTSKTTGLATKTTRVPILNLQLSSKSVAKPAGQGRPSWPTTMSALSARTRAKFLTSHCATRTFRSTSRPRPSPPVRCRTKTSSS